MKLRRPLLILGGALSALLLTAWVVMQSTSPTSPQASPVVEVNEAERQPTSQAAASTPVEVDLRSAVSLDSVQRGREASSVEPYLVEVAELPARLHGRVLDRRTGEGLEGHEVVIELPAFATAAPIPGLGEDQGRLRSTTAADGGFVLEFPLPVLPNLVGHVSILDRAQQVSFSGPALLVEGMCILVEPDQLLHGQISGTDRLQCETFLGFSLLQDQGVAGTRAHSLGRGVLDSNGRFAVRGRIAWPEAPVYIKVGCGDQVFALRTDVATITSQEGFHGALDISACEVTVADDRGRRLAGVSIAAAPASSTRNGSFVRCTTDGEGRVTVFVPKEGVEMAAAFGGHRIATRLIQGDPAPASVEFVLFPLDDSDRIEGRVLASSGSPVAGALVTALPAMTAEVVRIVQPATVRTDSHGHFALRLGGTDTSFDVTGFHKSHGMSAMLRISPGSPPVELVLPGIRPLTLHAIAPRSDVVSRGGDFQWCIQSIDGSHSDSGVDPLPIRTLPVPQGSYNVTLFWREMELFGQANLTVDAAAPKESNEVVVTLEPAQWFEGEVVGGSTSTWVVHRNPTWGSAAVALWGTVACDSAGRFRVLGGNRVSGPLEACDQAGNVIARATANAGSYTSIRP